MYFQFTFLSTFYTPLPIILSVVVSQFPLPNVSTECIAVTVLNIQELLERKKKCVLLHLHDNTTN